MAVVLLKRLYIIYRGSLAYSGGDGEMYNGNGNGNGRVLSEVVNLQMCLHN